MEQLYRDQFAHFINTGTSEEPIWTLEGVGVDALALAYNPQIDQYKTIIQRNADATFNNYQLQTAVSGKRIYKGDAMYEYLNEARRNMKALETQILEVEMAEKDEDAYIATKFNCLIVIDEFLGENATIGYTLLIKGDPTHGNVTMSADKKPTFVEKI